MFALLLSIPQSISFQNDLKKSYAFSGTYNNATDPVAANTFHQPICAFER